MRRAYGTGDLIDRARDSGKGNVENREKRNWSVSTNLNCVYEIRTAEPLLDPSNRALIDVGESRNRRLIVVDDGVPSFFRDQIERYFAVNAVTAEIIIVHGGEACKSFETVQRLIGVFESFGLNRRTEPVIVFGGGALLDVVGFSSSIYRRGIPVVRVPTTLLSYIDASVGLKTGINFGNGKNLVGSFTPPLAVFLERSFLSWLPDREIGSGLGEILKLAVGCNADLISALETNGAKFRAKDFADENVREILFRSIDIMLDELAPNAYERDLCRVVDLGHTFSQVLEMAPEEEALRHGEAVAIDVNLAALVSMDRGMLSRQDAHRIARLTERLGLPMTIPHSDCDRIWASVIERARHRGGKQRIPIPVQLGKCTFINDLTREEVSRAITEFQSRPWRDDIDTDRDCRLDVAYH